MRTGVVRGEGDLKRAGVVRLCNEDFFRGSYEEYVL